MALFSALLAVQDGGVAVHAVLGREADRLRERGDQRSRGQLMADLLVQRVIEPSVTGAGGAGTVSMKVTLVVSDRLSCTPSNGQLVARDSQARRFTGRLAEFLRLRDQACRAPWCDAPIRHLDHVQAHADGGPTDATNGQGPCEACNYAKQAQGWQARPRPGPRPTVETITPTGHVHAPISRPACARRLTIDLVLAS